MVAFGKQLLTGAALLSLVHGHPTSFEFGSLNPAWAVKRTLYDLDDISDKGHKEKLTQGLKDAVTIASTVLKNMDSDKYKPRLKFWFGDQNSDDNARETIRQVYKNFVGENKDGTGADVNGKIVVSNTDYWKPTADQTDGVGDGKTPFCKLSKDGKTGTAYYKQNPDNKNKPSMHFCDKIWDRADLATLKKDKCAALGDHVSTTAWAKNFIGANVLHEFMHYPKIGKEAIGKQIGDVIYDAWQCRELAVDPDVERRKKTILNADTYVWYALEIAFTEICGKGFSGVRDERDDDSSNQDWPDSNAS